MSSLDEEQLEGKAHVSHLGLRSSRYTGVTRGRKKRQNRDNGERALGKKFLKKKLAMGREGR